MRYSVERGLWYADIGFPDPLVFGMFVRIVLARVQPFAAQSEVNPNALDSFISAPVVLHYCPLSADRTIQIWRENATGAVYCAKVEGRFPCRENSTPLSWKLRMALELRHRAHDQEDPFGFQRCEIKEDKMKHHHLPASVEYLSSESDASVHELELVWDVSEEAYKGRFSIGASVSRELGRLDTPFAPRPSIMLEEVVENRDSAILNPELGAPTPQIISATRIPIVLTPILP